MEINLYLIFGIVFLAGVLSLYLKLKTLGGNSSVAVPIEGLEVMEIQLSRNEEAPKDNQFAAMAAENIFAALHGFLKETPDIQEHFAFEMASSGKNGLRFYAAVPSHTTKFVESQIYAQYPSAQIKVVQDYAAAFKPDNLKYELASATFTKPNFFPIKGFRDFETDPIASITSAMSSVGEDDSIWFQILFRPIPDGWQSEGQTYVKSVRSGTASAPAKPTAAQSVMNIIVKEGSYILTDMVTGVLTFKPRPIEDPKLAAKPQEVRISATQELELRAIENKMSRMAFEAQVRIFSAAPTQEKVDSNMRSLLASLKQFSTSTQNSFSSTLESSRESALEQYRTRTLDPNRQLLLSTEELATIYHLPSSNIETPTISWIYSRKSEPPSNLPVDNCVYLGNTTYRSKQIRFGLANGDDRLRHMYLIGKSGTGKSTMLESMIAQDIANGQGVGVLDPHGETIDKILERIPDNRIEDIIYFDPSDFERPIGLNLLELDDPGQKNLMASALVAAIKQHFDYSWGPRLEYLLNYAFLTLLEVPGTTMLGVTRLMEDMNYQKFILHNVKDPLVVRFWENEFKEMRSNQKMVTEAIAPIQNKVNRFLASTTIRNILGQKKSTVNLWDAMNDGKIILMNLSKGKIGADNANLLGALLVSRLQFYALQRAKIPYDKRRPFYLYVDEFQNFATGSFEEILSESRKYKLGLYLTHQFTAQLPEELLKAVFGNVGTIASFGLGAPDAKVLEQEFAPYFTSEDIISLERFNIFIKLMVNGMTSRPFSARILVPWEDKNFLVPKTDNRDKVIEFSRNKYGTDHKLVEERINKWLETQFDKGLAIAQEKKAQTPGTVQVESQSQTGVIN